LVLFWYDRHPDHLTVNRVTASLLQRAPREMELLAYFVYANWQLLSEEA
jgi:LmbE family N-acetylglucosaminyl deacetylase